MNVQICRFCSAEYFHNSPRFNGCQSQECKATYNRELYKKRLSNKLCKHCSKEFLATEKQTTCVDCRQKIKRNRNLQVINVKILCKCCSDLIEIVSKKFIGQKDTKYSEVLCEKCLKNSRINQSITKQGEKNPNYKNGQSFAIYSTTVDEEGSLKKIRLKNPNRIKRERKPKTVRLLRKPYRKEKVKKELPKGINHKRFKGNRPNDKIIRTRLSPWKKKYLKKANYTCESCGIKNTFLEIHHESEPMRDIYDKFCYDKPLKDYDSLSPEFEKLIQRILKYHMLYVKGRSLCPPCHAKYDKHRKVKNQKNQQN